MPPKVVGLGEILWDCFGETRRPGGAPANVAFQANQLGLSGIVCSRVGDDAPGRALRDFLKGQGLATTYVQTDPVRPTSTVTVHESASGPDYTIHENVAWDGLEFTSEWKSLLGSAAALCFGTLAQRSTVSRDTIVRCLKQVPEECRCVFDVNLRQRWFSREILDQSIGHADIVKLNEAEVPIVAELLDLPPIPAEFARAIFDRGPARLVSVTLGGDGCLAMTPAETVRVRPETVALVDTVGAGDAFTAGLIYAQLHAWPLEKSARFANAVGGLVASRAGAMPDLRSEFADLKERLR